MKIVRHRVWVEDFELTRPYTITFRTVTSVPNMIVELEDEHGRIGVGAGSPEKFVTGETFEDCKKALEGFDFDSVSDLSSLQKTPAARAAVDIALWDLKSQTAGRPLVQLLGQKHDELPTSITIGIKSIPEIIEEAKEYEDRGFQIIKLKLGRNLEEDIERTFRLREQVKDRLGIRVDLNQGYDTQSLLEYLDKTRDLNIEFCEQPLPVQDFAQMAELSKEIRDFVAADECLLTPENAQEIASQKLCGILNIKLMKCGGVTPALEIAKTAAEHGLHLMWGCMDESRISISAALHAAFSRPETRYIDLDGHLDLDRDIADAGFSLENGRMRPRLDRPGHGARLF